MEALISMAISLALYLLPTIIAAARHKRNVVAIGALNILLGWTLIGWVVALVWSLMHDKPDSNQQPMSREQHQSIDEIEKRMSRSRVWIAVLVVAAGVIYLVYQHQNAEAPIGAEQTQQASPDTDEREL
ncbi:superinfection immunity protein [Salinicola sp. CPA57]|uniref:superinfection immunity protein n=1 Tax=Salinicola sp. CPA57 TaxID=1949080 RepID=UPI000DA14C6C|nr:superinfection immunity protein [Salinicola sp. CPA57]